MASVDRAWVLDTLDFRLLWEAEDGSDYPDEFVYAGVDVVVDDERGRTTRLRGGLTPGQRAALRALSRPASAIGVAGIDASQDFADGSHHLRIVSARDDGDTVYIAKQAVTSDISRGGRVSITRHSAALWTRDLVALLPTSTGAGRLPTDIAVQFTQIPLGGEALTAIVTPPTAVSAATAFTHPQPGSCGTIRVQAGSVTDGRSPTAIEARYRDIPDDGRYLLVIDNPGSAIAVDDEGFAKMLNRVLNAVHARRAASMTGAQP